MRDAIVPMAAFAAVTDRIHVGSGVINNWTRNIGLLAATFLTLDDLAPNRDDLWHRRLVGSIGEERRHRAAQTTAAMRETVEVLRRLLGDGNVTFHGEFHHVDGIELDVRAWAPRAAQCPDHDRRHRRPDDGIDRRDCGRRSAELLRAA